MSNNNRGGKRTGQANEERRLLKKGKRGILNVIFGRTMLVVLTLALQIALLVAIFSSLQSMQSMLPFYYALLLLLYGAMILHLVNKSSEPTTKITWILLVVLAPPVGLALYLFVEMDVGHRVLNRRLGELMAETATLLPEKPPLPEGAAEAAPELEGLARYTWEHGRFPLYGNTDARYLSSGEASLEAMLEDLRAAKDFIFLEFFIIDEGYMWGRVLKVLEDKVREGVEVRVMYDGTCALFRLPYRYPEMLEKLGIQCKMFSPIRPMISTHYNNRDHRKILVIDGRVAYTGGVNLADEYVNNIGSRFGHWKDVSLRLEGEAVRSFTLMFLQMWNVNETGDRYRPLPGRAGGRPGGRAGLGAALRRQPGGQRAGGRAGLHGHPQPRPAVRAHHDALPDPGHGDARGADLRRQAGRGGVHPAAPHPRQEVRLRPGQDPLRGAAGGGRAHLRIHPRLRPRQDLRLRRLQGRGGHHQPGLPQPVPAL